MSRLFPRGLGASAAAHLGILCWAWFDVAAPGPALQTYEVFELRPSVQLDAAVNALVPQSVAPSPKLVARAMGKGSAAPQPPRAFKKASLRAPAPAAAATDETPLVSSASAPVFESPTRGTDGARSGTRSESSGPVGAASGGILTHYLASARQRVAHHRQYPYLARRTGLEGTVCLRLSIVASGDVRRVLPTCGGAQRVLVEAALQSVAAAAPFPPLPAALGPELTIEVPVVFELTPR